MNNNELPAHVIPHPPVWRVQGIDTNQAEAEEYMRDGDDD